MSRFHQSTFARRLLREMLRDRAAAEHGDPEARTSPVRASWHENLHPAVHQYARQSLTDLPIHDYAHAINSSQAFAFNLFLPFLVGVRRPLAEFLSAKLERRVDVVDVEFEFYGSGDLLAEVPTAVVDSEALLTRADVAVHLRDLDTGKSGLLLVEVKLSESGFTPCGGARSRGNRDRAPCESASVFFEDPTRCYLRRPYRAERNRRYWEIFAAAHGGLVRMLPGADLDGRCPFIGDWQQPMRNHALALAAVQAGLADFWALALVHHDLNPDVPEGWDAYAQASADESSIYRWPAGQLILSLDAAIPEDAIGTWLKQHYHLEKL